MYQGHERRIKNESSNICSQHQDLTNDLTVIKCSVISIEKTLTENVGFKQSIINTFIGMALIIILQIVGFAFLYGKLVNQVGVNTERLSVLEKK